VVRRDFGQSNDGKSESEKDEFFGDAHGVRLLLLMMRTRMRRMRRMMRMLMRLMRLMNDGAFLRSFSLDCEIVKACGGMR